MAPSADHRDDTVVPAVKIARDGISEPGGNRRRGVRRAEGVVLAFLPAGKARETATLAQGTDLLAPAGQDLVRIALMADIPDQLIPRRIEQVVQGDGQFDNAEAGTQMSAGN